jgi:hypothetical protein
VLIDASSEPEIPVYDRLRAGPWIDGTVSPSRNQLIDIHATVRQLDHGRSLGSLPLVVIAAGILQDPWLQTVPMLEARAQNRLAEPLERLDPHRGSRCRSPHPRGRPRDRRDGRARGHTRSTIPRRAASVSEDLRSAPLRALPWSPPDVSTAHIGTLAAHERSHRRNASVTNTSPS